jgi:hypothetical protein
VARADHHDINLPWSDQLPALPVGAGVQPHAAPRCRKPTLSCVTRVVREMRRRWRPLDRRCNHGAVFALTYLRTTEGLLATLRRDPGFFQDRSYLLWEDALFADYYFRAYDAYFRGKGFVPRAWRTAFRADRRGDYNGGHDVLLGMNAHIQRDLPYVLAEEGLRRPDGATRKPDHDRVNRILSQVLDPIQAELARRYDPLFDWSDIRYAPADELGVLEMMKSWREGAWRNAERLINARTAADRKAVSDSIESYSGTWARSIANGEVPGYRTFRDGYCRSHQARIRRQARRRAARQRHRRHRHR